MPGATNRQASFMSKPMTDAQARSLIDRLKMVIDYRIALSKGNVVWRDVAQKTRYDGFNRELHKDITNIDRVKNGSTYKIEAHDVTVGSSADYDAVVLPPEHPETDKVYHYTGDTTEDFVHNKYYLYNGSSWVDCTGPDHPVYPDGETTDDNPDPIKSAKFIIKSMDGVAILNSILSFDDIRPIYAGDPDGQQFGNGIINRALRSLALIDPDNPDHKSSTYRINMKQNGDIVWVSQHREYPTHEDSKWDQFYVKFEKLSKTIAMEQNSGNGYVLDHDYDVNVYGMTQRQYVNDIIDFIEHAGAGSRYHLITYVKDFVNDYIRAGTKLPSHPPKSGTAAFPDADIPGQAITAAFDYYLLDYIVQILEAENGLWAVLMLPELYGKPTYPSTTPKHNKDDTTTYGKQQNDAPHYWSTCGGYCVGLCVGSCVNTCNGCGGCTSFCSTQCGDTCRADCIGSCGGEACDNQCYNGCYTSCESECVQACKMDCETGCKERCTTACVDTCKDACKTGCKTQCAGNCKDGCKTDCIGNCGTSCDGTGMEITTITTTNKGSTSYGGPPASPLEYREQIRINPDGSRTTYWHWDSTDPSVGYNTGALNPNTNGGAYPASVQSSPTYNASTGRNEFRGLSLVAPKKP